MIPYLQRSEPFPPLSQALTQPNGLLCAGADLSPARLLEAYRNGIFPWYMPGDPLLWWSPDPRMLLFPSELRISRSFSKVLRHRPHEVRFDTCFARVMSECAAPRGPGESTWISDEMQQAYGRLHELGYAHSVETWVNDELVGGLYGVAIGHIFFGESMFSRQNDASKIALAYLCHHLQRCGYAVIDCQMKTDHLSSLGGREMARADFLRHLPQWTGTDCNPQPGRWTPQESPKPSNVHHEPDMLTPAAPQPPKQTP
ncbi:MAG: leucyl/phenylalanyl-tRNA--protein transferase [Sterolibacterium sp.]|nr:leucyl/phenylalanyl-tRNA--protein transferase [Sterolibacterium sp.]MBP9798842.1 leucyl/phenylalanyl-tRNA--protein transferase [Sterolibacterium sp.]